MSASVSSTQGAVPAISVPLFRMRVLVGPDAGAEAASEHGRMTVGTAEGATLPVGLTGTFTGADGLSRPIVFDDDGFALVPGVPAGQGRLRLASRVPAYEAP